jgi:hypothetical protein
MAMLPLGYFRIRILILSTGQVLGLLFLYVP